MHPDSSPSSNTFLVTPGAFPPTQWSMILRADEGSQSQVRLALESLCCQYWYPLYTFVRRQGKTHHEAEDCTQEFLARLLASDGVAKARPERGRFRTFLLTSLRNFLINEWHRTQTAKRGGGLAPLPLEFDTAEERFAKEPADPALTPEQAFDRNWAVSVINRVFDGLRTEYETSQRGELFAVLAPLVRGSPSQESHSALAARLNMNTHAFTMAVQRVRRRLGERLRADVAQTVADGTDVDAELRHLIAALGGSASAG